MLIESILKSICTDKINVYFKNIFHGFWDAPYTTAGVVNLRLFEELFLALDKCTRVPFSFLCYHLFKNDYRSECVSKCLLNY